MSARSGEIVQDYSDHGRSGLDIAGREGLNQLMADVEAKRTNFTSLLVYVVGRCVLADNLELVFRRILLVLGRHADVLSRARRRPRGHGC